MALPYYDPNGQQPTLNYADYYRAPKGGKKKQLSYAPRPNLMGGMRFNMQGSAPGMPSGMPIKPGGYQPPQLRYGSMSPGGMFRRGPAVPYGNPAYQNAPAMQPMYSGGSQYMNYSGRDMGGNLPGEWDYRQSYQTPHTRMINL